MGDLADALRAVQANQPDLTRNTSPSVTLGVAQGIAAGTITEDDADAIGALARVRANRQYLNSLSSKQRYEEWQGMSQGDRDMLAATGFQPPTKPEKKHHGWFHNMVFGLGGAVAHPFGGGSEVTCPRFPGHLIWRDHRVGRGVWDASTKAAGVPAPGGRARAAA